MSDPAARRQNGNITWLVGIVAYLVLVGGVTYGMFQVRAWSVKNYSTAKAQSDWESWREETRRQSTATGPVQRRAAKSEIPPIVKLMDDYFWTCWLAIMMMLSVIYATLFFLLVGAFGGGSSKTPDLTPRARSR